MLNEVYMVQRLSDGLVVQRLSMRLQGSPMFRVRPILMCKQFIQIRRQTGLPSVTEVYRVLLNAASSSYALRSVAPGSGCTGRIICRLRFLAFFPPESSDYGESH